MNERLAEFEKKAFVCPVCGVYSRQIWRSYYIESSVEGMHIRLDSNDTRIIGPSASFQVDEIPNHYHNDLLSVVLCSNCENHSIWMNRKMIFPNNSIAPLPTVNMPEEVLADFNEARSIYSISPKASAALLRLSLQKLCVILGGKGNKINDDIRLLVEKGLPGRIQKALDIVRVVGNEAVHPGQIDVNDNPSIAISLFDMINFIVDKMITEPKEIDDIYRSLPQDKLDGIEKRDKNA